ncbi:hypothetical protein NDU88_004354 [Pleurodeles waltl]|uniref:Uncharacterized protein n=1 Tax=Pleurodeles waltl TaxID=8319 RepID=A0AAV7UEX1_PLEWA|nr:hypothetical protein NDU88_004354 [Pleurodeles waltl]
MLVWGRGPLCFAPCRFPWCKHDNTLYRSKLGKKILLGCLTAIIFVLRRKDNKFEIFQVNRCIRIKNAREFERVFQDEA